MCAGGTIGGIVGVMSLGYDAQIRLALQQQQPGKEGKLEWQGRLVTLAIRKHVAVDLWLNIAKCINKPESGRSGAQMGDGNRQQAWQSVHRYVFLDEYLQRSVISEQYCNFALHVLAHKIFLFSDCIHQFGRLVGGLEAYRLKFIVIATVILF